VGGCGGTLVTERRVLTAAHCLTNRSPASLGGVVVGDGTRTYTRFALHPNWRQANGTGNYADDLAIVELSAPIPGATTVTLGGPEPAEAWILGQGRPFAPGTGHSEAEMLDTTLRMAPLRSLTDAECERAFRGYRPADGERYLRRMRCSIDADGKAPLHSGCNGDSGGPLWTGTPEAPVQLGVVSWGGDRCGADHLPSVFADVARSRGFILDPSPIWAPTRTGSVVVRGTARAGRTLTCAAAGYVPEAGARVAYEWRALPRGGAFGPDGTLKPQRPLGEGRRHTIRRREVGGRIACFVTASNEGGSVGVGVASRLVRHPGS
jgi:trypsin